MTAPTKKYGSGTMTFSSRTAGLSSVCADSSSSVIISSSEELSRIPITPLSTVSDSSMISVSSEIKLPLSGPCTSASSIIALSVPSDIASSPLVSNSPSSENEDSVDGSMPTDSSASSVSDALGEVSSKTIKISREVSSGKVLVSPDVSRLSLSDNKESAEEAVETEPSAGSLFILSGVLVSGVASTIGRLSPGGGLTSSPA